ncbi:MAG: hypothetical protein DSY88_03830 [Candidatus Poseidoniales archaeon]|nr:MAG: hypothetical protein DSY88_03830 [Candidatus Poseidoniales archaeon]
MQLTSRCRNSYLLVLRPAGRLFDPVDGGEAVVAGFPHVVFDREDLPVRDSVRFCPFCGSDLRPYPCRECGEAMEARWQFCVSCGTDVRG